MSFGVLQARRFARQYKKLHDNVVAAVETVADNPAVGCAEERGASVPIPIGRELYAYA